MKGRRARRAAGVAVASTIVSLLQPSPEPAMGQAAGLPGPVHRGMLCRDADGRLTIAVAGAGAAAGPGCRVVALPVSPDGIRWVGALPQAEGPGRDRLVLSGTGQGAGFVVSGAGFEEPAAPSSRPTSLALDRSLIPALAARTFGVEERAALSRTDEAVTLRCSSGERPAGLVLDPGRARLPDEARFTLRWRVRGDSGFSVAVAGPGTDGNTVAVPADGTLDQPPPTQDAARETPWFVLACPASAGTLTLLDVRLAPRTPDRGAAQPPRSAWAWRPGRWRDGPEGLIAEARTLGVERLFVTVEIEDGAIAQEARFSDFVGLAGEAGIAVAVVEGDPGMALDAGRTAAIGRLGALVAYQRRAAPGRHLAGVQYDIEPYLLPGFRADPEGILRGWAATLDGLSAAAPPLDLDLVLPFWLPLHPSAGLVLPAIGRVAHRVTVMAYRTTPAEILAAAEPMLAWTASAALPLHVAVEAGPVSDETTRTYRRAETGDLLLLPQVEGGALVLLLAAPTSLNTPDGLYALERESVVPGSRVSFLGDRGRLDETVARLSPGLSAWPNFSGFALHGLID